MPKRLLYSPGQSYTVDTVVAQLRAYADKPPSPGEPALRDAMADWMRAAAAHCVGVMCDRDRLAELLKEALPWLDDGWDDSDLLPEIDSLRARIREALKERP